MALPHTEPVIAYEIVGTTVNIIRSLLFNTTKEQLLSEKAFHEKELVIIQGALNELEKAQQ